MTRPRFLVLRLPAFPLERCGFEATDLAATIDVIRGATRLVALTPAACAGGLAIGATASEARAIVPEIVLLPHDAAGEAQDRVDLLRAFDGLSDRVTCGVGGPGWNDTLLIEVSNLPQSEATTGAAALERASNLGHAASAGIADDPFSARAAADGLAGLGEVAIVISGQTAARLAALPFTCLFPEEELRRSLEMIGVETIGQFAALDPAAVAGRYGPAGARLHRIARGDAPWAGVPPASDPERPCAFVALPGATTRQELALVLPALALEVALKLESKCLAASQVRITMQLDDGLGTENAITIRTGRATRSAKTIERLVRQRLERIEVTAPIEALGIEVVQSAPEFGWQPGLADRTEQAEPLPDLLARLADQFGEEALFAPGLVSDWRPERAWVRRRFQGPRLAKVAEVADPVGVLEAWERGHPLPRPVLLLAEPERIEVEPSEAGPVRAWVGQQWRRVERCVGPEQLFGVWWEPSLLDRAYFVISVGDRCLWVFSDRRGWWLHGYFD